MAKPGDHPDFFRFPAPAGRSRESVIRLDGDGRFWDGDERIEHPGMTRAFLGWIDLHPDDGRYVLTNGYDWTYVTVEDVPFLITGLAADPKGFRGTLNDGTSEILRGPLWRDARGALHAQVKQGRFPARFSRQCQAGLGDFLCRRGGGWLLRLGDAELPIA